MKIKMRFLIVLVLSLLFIIGVSSVDQRKALTGDLQGTKEAPNFTLPDINGKSFNFSKLKGKVILLDFWATWCPFCRESIPILLSLYNDYKEKGLGIVGVALEYDDGKVLKRFVKEKNISYPILIGNEELAKKYSAYGVPTRFLINRKGEIVEKFIGFQDKETFEQAIKELL